ncbi:MAG TPA: hypothetical protein PLR74_18745, partial [Agriterribacter sp.]|nr:hypothetical protein [Agriterribacter sp.]
MSDNNVLKFKFYFVGCILFGVYLFWAVPNRYRRQEKAVIETVFYAWYSAAQCNYFAFLLIKSF